MTSASVSDIATSNISANVAAGNRRARLRESLLGYLFAAPALIITFFFGLFPVILGFVISMQDGTIIPTGFVGFRNYLAALGSIAYSLAIALALVLIICAYLAFRVLFKARQEGKGDYYPYLFPGTLTALATLLFLGFAFGNLLELLLLPL